MRGAEALAADRHRYVQTRAPREKPLNVNEIGTFRRRPRVRPTGRRYRPRGTRGSQLLKLPPLPRRRDVEDLAVLGHGAAGEVDALVLQLLDDLVVVQRVVLVLVVDDRLELLLHRVPAHLLAFGAGG